MIPAREAIAPVMNGTAALPTAPTPAIAPIDPVNKCGGNTRPAWFIAMGYTGPKNMPTRETQTAPPTNDGTSQNINWRLSHIDTDNYYKEC